MLDIAVINRLFHLGRTIGNFSPLAACIATSDAMRASPHGGGFQVISRPVPTSPVS